MNPLRLYGDYGFIDRYSVSGAQWVANYVPYEYNLLADNGYFTALTAYGLIYRGYVDSLTNASVIKHGEFVYLSYITVQYEQLSWNGTLPIGNQTDLVYSNGGTEVYYNP